MLIEQNNLIELAKVRLSIPYLVETQQTNEGIQILSLVVYGCNIATVFITKEQELFAQIEARHFDESMTQSILKFLRKNGLIATDLAYIKAHYFL